MTIPRLVVRSIQADDMPAFLRLLQAKAAFDGVEHAIEANEAELARELFSPNARTRVVVALMHQQVVGMATYFHTFSSFLMKPGLWMDDLYIDEQCRNRGIGKQILTWLCTEAAACGCVRIDWTVAVGNSNGQAFYKHMGARICESVRLARLDEKMIHEIAEREI